MTILEEQVLIYLNGRTIKHFEGLGYKIPRYLDSQGRLNIKKGTNILVKVNDLQPYSEAVLTKICDECGKKIENQAYKTILKNRKNGLDLCHKCAKLKQGNKIRINVPYERSLEYYAKTNNIEYILSEFSDKNIKNPKEISYGTRDVYWWKCPKCNSDYEMSANARTNKEHKGCPFCVGRRVNHTNCLWTTHPNISKLLNNKERGYKITAGTNKKEDFKCEICGYSRSILITSVVAGGFTCPKCSDGISYPEKFVFSLLSQLNIYFEKGKVFNWSKNYKCEKSVLDGKKIYDFYIPSISCVIEVHGRQHYDERQGLFATTRDLDFEKNNDSIKRVLAIENGIKNYIVVDCKFSKMEYIKNNILNSEMGNLIDLSNIDWLQCHNDALNTLVKKVCNLWCDGKRNLTEIANSFKLSRNTVNLYLKQGAKLGWCDYSPKNFIGDRTGKSIVQLNLSGEFIKCWDTMADAYKETGISVTNISSVCRGKKKSAGGFKWIYKDVYEEIQNN